MVLFVKLVYIILTGSGLMINQVDCCQKFLTISTIFVVNLYKVSLFYNNKNFKNNLFITFFFFLVS